METYAERRKREGAESLTRGGDTQTQKKEGRPAKEEAANALCSLSQTDKEGRTEGGGEGREDEQAAGGWSFSLA